MNSHASSSPTLASSDLTISKARNQARLADLFQHPAWPLVEHFLQVRLRTCQEQCLLLDPESAARSELLKRQGEARLLKLLLDDREAVVSRVLDSLER